MKPYQQNLTQKVTTLVVKGLTTVLCRVDGEQLKRVPTTGPLILVSNHVNFLEAPVIYTRLMPRPLTGYAKIETWDNPLLGWLFDVWDIIPIRRGEPDKSAVKSGLQVLKEGCILTIAPEGTRNRDGRLLRGHPGVVMLALLSGAPLLPIVHYGHENFRDDFRILRRTEFHVVVGDAFTLDKRGEKVTSETRQKMVDEIMYQIAALLPPQNRGAYFDFSMATEKYLEFTLPARSNLLKANNRSSPE
jgi:1-acyl-sn-glycerol-3-phosphate acyltransferase